MKKTIYLSSIIAILSSCTAKKVATAPEVIPKTEIKPVDVKAPVANSAFYSAINKPATFSQVKINSRINFDMGAYVPTADATFYIENGQKVWMNLSAAFINVARGIATPNGMKGYEKLGRNYIESDFAYLNKLLNVNFLHYNSFQNLLLGKTFVPVNDNDFVLTKNAQGYQLNSTKTQKVTADGKDAEYAVKLQYTPDFDLSSVFLKDKNSTDNLEVLYSNWSEMNGHRFPRNVKIIIKGKKSGQILIENTKFGFDKMETPYSVPENYTKKEIR